MGHKILAGLVVFSLIFQSITLHAEPASTSRMHFKLTDAEAIGFMPFFFSQVNTVGKLNELAAGVKGQSPDARFLKRYLSQFPSGAKLPRVTAKGSILTVADSGKENTVDVSMASSGRFKINGTWVQIKGDASLREIYEAVSRVIPNVGTLPKESARSKSMLHHNLLPFKLVDKAYAGPEVAGIGLGTIIGFIVAVKRGNDLLDSLLLGFLFGWFYVLYAVLTPLPAGAAENVSIQNPKCPQNNDGTMQLTYKLPTGEKTLAVQYDGEKPSRLTETSVDSSGIKSSKVFLLNSDWSVSSPAPTKTDFAAKSGLLAGLQKMNQQCLIDPAGLAKAVGIMSGHPAAGANTVAQPLTR